MLTDEVPQVVHGQHVRARIVSLGQLPLDMGAQKSMPRIDSTLRGVRHVDDSQGSSHSRCDPAR
jgi:hypothetical protein